MSYDAPDAALPEDHQSSCLTSPVPAYPAEVDPTGYRRPAVIAGIPDDSMNPGPPSRTEKCFHPATCDIVDADHHLRHIVIRRDHIPDFSPIPEWVRHSRGNVQVMRKPRVQRNYSGFATTDVAGPDETAALRGIIRAAWRIYFQRQVAAVRITEERASDMFPSTPY